MKNVSRLLTVLLITAFIAGCAPNVSETTPTQSPQQTAPLYTLSPIIKPTPIPTIDPNSPSPIPSNSPADNDYYIYTLEHGDGRYPYAWSLECPIKNELKYGASGSEVSALQTRLTQLGFYCGGTSGRFNALTLTALNEFQAVCGLTKTDYLDRATINVLFSPDGIEAMQITDYDITEGILEGITVFVDAGHGGTDTGTARGSLVERTFVIETSHRLKQMLEKAGARVIMTRNDDTLVSLAYRSAITNDVILEDMCKAAEAELRDVEEKTSKIMSLKNMSVSELKQKTELLTKDISNTLKLLCDASKYAEGILSEYGEGSAEYLEAKRQLSEAQTAADKIKDEYELVLQAYYSIQMGVSLDVFLESYNVKNQELSAYINKLRDYRADIKVTLDNLYDADTGLWVKQYDEAGMKIINEKLKEILDLIGEKAPDNYMFISVHVNGVDNADHVNGTEIYVRNNNSTNNTYGINRYYYSNYNVVKRAEFASCIKKALDEVVPLQNDKAAVIKDSDLWVLREINIPCILLETGYVTNLYDRIMLQHPQTRNAFAYALYCGVCYYRLG